MPISQEIGYTTPIASYSDAYLWVMYASIICAHTIYYDLCLLVHFQLVRIFSFRGDTASCGPWHTDN
ncbi:uncharacterized protein BO88DRAFT_402422 [Aspergillus vadensis CBS 113365]|uniref:Uncharacterized protein n=1 Tax=Aspergillus vadensis (strain CBS 113365 / IMI 142717 / IBT 24658) TaxID=1448311 RepID=A0A319BHA9_ASPVC|nr:hypothetical protein BO88DRAFT_402422 [Aspergillus vadensis CBS 113365]PYH72165.1 hypothetical protein BO88DRAFT_402422 [Aspergillus vadensis CBS 113365]